MVLRCDEDEAMRREVEVDGGGVMTVRVLRLVSGVVGCKLVWQWRRGGDDEAELRLE